MVGRGRSLGAVGDVEDRGRPGPTRLERDAEGQGYRPWDPQQESYDTWELGFVHHLVRTRRRWVRRNYDWYVGQGFRTATLDTFLEEAHRPFRRQRPLMSGAMLGAVLICLVSATLVVFYLFFPDEARACLVIIVIECVVVVVGYLLGSEG